MHTLFKFSFLLLSIVFFNISSYAQESKTDTIKVYGNCNMCKEKIEGSLKEKDGITAKNWDKKTKLLVVTYDAAKISKEQIGQKIADVGYDNQYATATEKAYKKLHSCCQYDRPKQPAGGENK
ncbi:MAG TPA: cation transporter [Bacteroidia bacterium]|jgi:mercuric ion binding protein|nr:cation transporter [Bacteroidia bacterium]HMU19101.1 cation transporter [Bacteroidia bacterium]